MRGGIRIGAALLFSFATLAGRQAKKAPNRLPAPDVAEVSYGPHARNAFDL
jgi:hypothetical protein